MDNILRIVSFIAIIIYFSVFYHLLKKKRLSVRFALLWLFVGLVMLFVAIFPQVLEVLVSALGIVEMTHGLFALIIFFIIIILISFTAIVSRLNDQIRMLVQRCAMYEKRIRILEEQAGRESGTTADIAPNELHHPEHLMNPEK